MSRIVIEVDDQVANAFANANDDKRNKMSGVINTLLKKIINDATLNDYKQMLDKASDEATKNGLTEEMLKELLASDD
jgi:oligoendopeptidase F